MTKLDLELSDVFTLINKTSRDTFFIQYIDTEKIKLVNIETFSQVELKIDSKTGSVQNYEIDELVLIHRNPIKGFAAQNNLIKGTWIELDIAGNVGQLNSTYIGQITDTMHDQITIQMSPPNQQIIYLDFEYKGLSDTSPVKHIRIIEKDNTGIIEKDDNSVISEDNNIPDEPSINDVEEEDDHLSNELSEDSPSEKVIVEFGDDIIESVVELVDVDQSKTIYDIESQKLDLINSMLTAIPENKRTDAAKTRIYTIVDRFVQLRTQYSDFDGHGNIQGVKTVQSEGKPLNKYFDTFRSPIQWVIPGVQSTKVLYDTSHPSNEENDLIEHKSNYNSLNEFNEIVNHYRTSNSTSGVNAYKLLNQQLNTTQKPFTKTGLGPVPTFSKSVGRRIHAVENPLTDYTAWTSIATPFESYEIKPTKFVTQEYLPEETMSTLDAIRGTTKTRHRLTQLTRPDKLDINSFLVMPDSIVRYSRVLLPSTSIMERANLSKHGFDAWRVLNDKTHNIFNVFVRSDNEPIKSAFMISTPPGSPTNSPRASPKTTPDPFQIVQKSNTAIASFMHLCDTNDDTINKTGSDADYAKLTDAVIPSVLNIFDSLKPFLTTTVSFMGAIRFFEPYLVYASNITHADSRIIAKFVQDNIDRYEQELQVNKSYWLKPFPESPLIPVNILIKLIQRIEQSQNSQTPTTAESDTVVNELLSASKDISHIYHHPGRSLDTFTSSELLSAVYNHDYGVGYTTVLHMDTLSTTLPATLEEYVDREKVELEEQLRAIASMEQTNTCQSIGATSTNSKIQKIYMSEALLLADNHPNAIVYADKQQDSTPYHLLSEVQPTQQDRTQLHKELAAKHTNLSHGDIETLVNNGITKYTLIRMLMETYQVTRIVAYDMATHIIEGQKTIADGDYAGIGSSSSDIHKYYQRQGDAWIEVNNPNVPAKTLNVLNSVSQCNLTPECISAENGQCTSMISQITENQHAAITRIYDSFKDGFHKEKTISANSLKVKHERNKRIRDKLHIIRGHMYLKANNKYYEFGHKFVQSEQSLISPYMSVLSTIINQSDFRKQQSDIIRFVRYFTRPHSPSIDPTTQSIESPHWLYCKTTGLPLLPVFKHTLASIFVSNEGDYPAAVLNMINTNGVLSDDGDMWVDKYTGMTIRQIDFDSSEGFDEAGFKISTRAIIDTADGNLPVLDIMPMTATLMMIRNIVTAFTSLIGITLDPKQMQFVFRNCTRVVDHNMNSLAKSEEEYTEIAKKRLARGDKIPSYRSIYHKQLIYATIGLVLIIIQSAIPTIKTSRTVPGCIQSFKGYPLEADTTDETGIMYIACVLQKLRSPAEPWNGIHKKIPDIIEKLKITMVPSNSLHIGLLAVPEVASCIAVKQQYLASCQLKQSLQDEEENDNTNDGLVLTSSIFLPPQSPVQIGNIETISVEIKKNLISQIKSGSPDQVGTILLIRSKLFKLSLKIQELIEEVIRNESNGDLLIKKLNGELYLENACCIPTDNKSSIIQYFRDKEPEFDRLLLQIEVLDRIIRDIDKLSIIPVIITTDDNRRRFSNTTPERSLTAIHTGIIQLCNIGTGTPPPSLLQPYCLNITELTKNITTAANDDLLELFRDNQVSFTNDQFLHMLRLVHERNSVNLQIVYDLPDPQFQINQELERIENDYYYRAQRELSNSFKELELIEFMKQITESKDDTLLQKHSDDFKEFLSKRNKELKTEVWRSIHKHSGSAKLTKRDKERVRSVIDHFTTWGDVMDPTIQLKSTETRNTEFYKVQIQRIVKTIPSIIITSRNIQMDTTIPELRNATTPQLTAISATIKSTYEPFIPLFDSPLTYRVLTNIGIYSKPILALSEATSAFLFEPTIVSKLYEYYFLKILKNYITLSTMREMVDDINAQPRLQSKIIDILIVMIQTIYSHKKTININHKTIMDRVFKRREIEKNTMIQKNRKKTTEENIISRELGRVIVEVHDKYQLDFDDPEEIYGEDEVSEDNQENDLITNEYGMFEE